jgi:hypothetical protein
MSEVFVSYSRKDREFVTRLVDVLEDRGWSVWWDPTIRPGQYYDDVIESALTDAKCVVVVWSKNSVGSKWVRTEAGDASDRGVLFPIVIDDARIPLRFRRIQEADLSDWKFEPSHPELELLLECITERLVQTEGISDAQPTSDEDETEEERSSLPGQIDMTSSDVTGDLNLDLNFQPLSTSSPSDSRSKPGAVRQDLLEDPQSANDSDDDVDDAIPDHFLQLDDRLVGHWKSTIETATSGDVNEVTELHRVLDARGGFVTRSSTAGKDGERHTGPDYGEWRADGEALYLYYNSGKNSLYRYYLKDEDTLFFPDASGQGLWERID